MHLFLWVYWFPWIPLDKDKKAADLQALVDQQGQQIEVLKRKLQTLQGGEAEPCAPNETPPGMDNVT